MITQAGGRSFLDEALDPPLHRVGVVERHRDRQVRGGLRNPGAVGERGVVLAVADVLVRDADRDHHVVVVAVVRAEDLHDRVATGCSAGDPDRVHRRLGARVRVAPFRQAEATGELFRDDDRVLSRGGEVRSQREPLAHRPLDCRVRVPLDHRPEPVVEVVQVVPVHVPDVGAPAAREVDRPGVAKLVGGGDAAGEGRPSPFVQGPRSRRPIVERLLLTCSELADASTVDLGEHGGHSDSPARFSAGRTRTASGGRWSCTGVPCSQGMPWPVFWTSAWSDSPVAARTITCTAEPT
jgi:hypothetical protein